MYWTFRQYRFRFLLMFKLILNIQVLLIGREFLIFIWFHNFFKLKINKKIRKKNLEFIKIIIKFLIPKTLCNLEEF